MTTASAQASVHSFNTSRPPPSYRPPLPRQSSEPKPPKAGSKSLRASFYISLIALITSLVLELLILIAGMAKAPLGSNKASRAAILLQDYAILSIPIKYRFLCNTGETASECEPRWTVKMFLNGVWAYEDVQGDYEPIHLLWKGVGRVFNLTNALMTMDETLALEGRWHLNGNYSVPTEPVQHVREMTPVTTSTPFILIVVSMSLALPVFVIWFWERCALNRHKRVKTVQRRWMLFVLLTMAACLVAAASYIDSTVSKAAAQLAGNTTYISSAHRKPRFGSKFQGLIAGAAIMQILTLVSFGLHCFMERRPKKRWTEYKKTLQERGRRMTAEQDVNDEALAEAPPEYTEELSDLEMIRMTERQELGRTQTCGDNM